MAGFGPPPKANAQRRGGGATPAKKASAPAAAATTPTPPVTLSADELAVWNWAWGTDVAGSWKDSDALTVASYARLVVEREVVAREIAATGHAVPGSRGQVSSNPLLPRLGSIDGEVRQLADRLGLNPAARIRLGLGAVQTALTVQHLRDALRG